jgi:alpha-tubulin suppressor-like RCC1 family protein
MSRSTRTAEARGATITLWLAGVMLSGVACRDDQILGPPEQNGAAERPALASTATALAFTQVSAGNAHTCGVTTSSQLYCWGANYWGQLGDGTFQSRPHPTLVGGGLLFKQVSAGDSYTCALTTGNRAYCWGYNGYRALGDGSAEEFRWFPSAVAGSRAFRQISAGTYRTCALTAATPSKIYCWGTGFLGNGAQYSVSSTPVLVSGARAYRQVSVGSGHVCGVTTTYKVFCWGSNNYGQLGNGAASDFNAVNPVAVAGTLQYLQVSAGSFHTCAVTISDKAFCWGNGRNGQIGDGKTNLRFTPRAVAGGLSFDRVSAGDLHTCGETTGNRAYCWGFNEFGRLGDGTFTQRLVPTAVSGGLFFKQVSAGRRHTCGVASGSVVWCWGHNSNGELANGTTVDTPSPTPVR